MKLTVTQLRCLLAVYALSGMREEVASKSVAKLLDVSKPTVHNMLDMLLRIGLLEKQPYGAARLTPDGLALAQRLEARKEKLVLGFSRRLRLPMDEAASAALLLMSGLTDQSLAQLEALE